MSFYCGIDLSATTSWICVLDDHLSVVLERKVPNELPLVLQALSPFTDDLRVVVESTFNWYWLVDGLQLHGIDVTLAHCLGLAAISKAKVKTDRRDAFTLAKLLRAGVIPPAYIYPRQLRPVRDLLRRRGHLVAARAHEYARLRMVLLRHGVLSSSPNLIKRADEDDLAHLLDHPILELNARLELERIALLSRQIHVLETVLLDHAEANPDFHRLRSIPGVGPTLALMILYEVGDISRFPSARDFCSYCRLVPGVAQSGDTSRRGRSSKQGNHYLKHAFSQAAVHAVRCYPNIRHAFERQQAKHRGRAKSLIAYCVIAHKLGLAAYHVLRDATSYKEDLLFST